VLLAGCCCCCWKGPTNSNLPVSRISFSSPTKAGGKEDKVSPLLLSQTKKSPTQDEESEDMDVIPVKQLLYQCEYEKSRFFSEEQKTDHDVKEEAIDYWEEEQLLPLYMKMANEQLRRDKHQEEFEKQSLQNAHAQGVPDSNTVESFGTSKAGERSTSHRTPTRTVATTSLPSATPPSRVSRGSIETVFSKASSRKSEGDDKRKVPYGSPCFGCQRRVCPNMRAVATVRRMSIKRFGMETLTQQNRDYKFNVVQRRYVYRIYKQHVSLKSVKHVPVCGMLMAMDWFPTSPNNRSTQDLRDKFSKQNRNRSSTDEGYHGAIQVNVPSDTDTDTESD